jgi:hypothetical protein
LRIADASFNNFNLVDVSFSLPFGFDVRRFLAREVEEGFVVIVVIDVVDILFGDTLPNTILLVQPEYVAASYDPLGFQIEKLVDVFMVVLSTTK